MAVIVDTRDYVAEEDWEDFDWILQDIFSALNDYKHLFVTGSVGRWNGTSSGRLYSNDAESTFRDIFKDCDDFLLETDKDNLLTITGWHHDGECSASWWTIDDLKKFEEKYYIDSSGDITKYGENDEEIYDVPFEEIEEFIVPANVHIH